VLNIVEIGWHHCLDDGQTPAASNLSNLKPIVNEPFLLIEPKTTKSNKKQSKLFQSKTDLLM